MKNPSQKNIIYINFSPYENAGRILDYIVSEFSTVLLFSFQFHKLADNQHSDKLIIYQDKKIVQKYDLIRAPTASSLTFFLLPIRSFIIFVQIVYYTLKLHKQYGPYDIYFTVNAFTAWTGNILKKIHLVRKTIFWVWDYYPPIHKDKIAMVMRWLYWQFDKPASRQADTVVFLHKRLEILRRKIYILPKNKYYKSIGIGTDPIRQNTHKKINIISLVFLGVLKKSQGLDLLFNTFEECTKKHNILLHIIGGGPDEQYFKKRAKLCAIKTQFYGYITDEKKVTEIINKCHIGIATYAPDTSNVSYYSDPSKIKRYLSSGLPVITTNVFEFSDEITKSKAGIVIPYKTKEFYLAVQTIIKNYTDYQKKALTLAKKYNYKKLYAGLFR